MIIDALSFRDRLAVFGSEVVTFLQRYDFKMAASMINEIDIIQDEMGVLDEVELSSEDEEAYCLCGEENTLEMIGCDSNICEYEWFHYHCVGFTDETIPDAEV